jgi:hypothetical protein
VGIPSLLPNVPGGLGPMTPFERQVQTRRREREAGVPAAPPPGSALPLAPARANPAIVRLLAVRGKRTADPSGRPLEERWYECLRYPLRAGRLCLSLALLLTVFSAGAALVLPGWLARYSANPYGEGLLDQHAPLIVFLLVMVSGIPCSFLDCVLSSSVEGEVRYIVWSGNPFLTVLLSGSRWLACFLAGPVVFAGTGFLYWLSWGDPSLLDWLILAELGVLAIAYHCFTLLSFTDRRRLRDLNPLAVADMVHRLGWRSLVVLAAAGLLLAHGWVLVTGIAEMHNHFLVGTAILVGGWASGVFWSTFFCRLLGVWCHRSRLAVIEP